MIFTPGSWIRTSSLTKLHAKKSMVGLALFASLLVSAPLWAAPRTAQDWYKQGDSQYQEGELDAAMVSLRKAIELKKDYVEAFVLLGNAYLENGNFQKAIPALKRASELKPNDYAVQLAYSNALEGAGQTKAQIPVLGKLFQLNPADLVIGIKYLTLMEQVGAENYPTEHVQVLEALSKTPNPDPSYSIKLAKAYTAAGEYPKAVAAYGDVVKKSPDVGEYWIGLARAQAKADPPASKASFDRAILLTESVADKEALKKEQAAALAPPIPVTPAVAATSTPVPVEVTPPPAPVTPIAAVTTPSAADKAAADKAAADKAAADKAAADKAAADKAAADKAAADKAAADKAAADKAAADKAAVVKAAADKAAADKAAADKAAADKAAADKAAADKAAADKAAADKAAADKAAADKAEAMRKEQARKDSVAFAQANQKTRDSLALVEKQRAAALVIAEKAYKDSLARAEKAYRDSLVLAEKRAKDDAAKMALQLQKQQDSILRAEKRYQDSLARAEKSRNDSLARAEKARMDSLSRAEAFALAQAKKDSAARAEEEKRLRMEAERKAKEEAERIAREEAEQKSKLRMDSTLRAETERRQREADEKSFQDQISAVISGAPLKLDTAALQWKIQERRATLKNPDSRLLEAEGILAYKQWNFALAIDAFRKAKSLGLLGNRYWAMALTEQGDHAAALKQYTKVADIRADRDIWNHYLKSLVESRQMAKAASEYEAYLTKYPDSEEATVWLVNYYRQPLQKEKLLPKLEAQWARNPNDPTLLAEIVSLTDISAPKAAEHRERYLKQNPDDVKVKRELAGIYEGKGRTADAIKLYRELAPNFTADKDFNLKLGEMLVSANRTTDALPYFETAANLDGNNKKLLLRLGALHESVKQPERALEFYNRALALDPKDAAVQAKVVQLAASRGKDVHKEALLRIAESDPQAHEANFQLAKISLAEGDKERAYGYLSKALKLQPANPQYQGLMPDVVTSDAQIADNLGVLEKAASQPGAKPELLLGVAKANAAKNNGAAAAKWYGQLYATSPKLLEGQKEAVVVLYEAKNLDAAGLLADRYLSKEPGDKEIRRIQLASLMSSPKGDAKLRESLTAYLEADPEGAAKYLLRLAELDLGAKDNGAAIIHAKAWVGKNPKDLAGLKFLATLLKGNAAEEESYLATLTALSAFDPAAKGKYDMELADIRYRRGDFQEADNLQDKAIKQNPADASLWFRSGEIAQKLRKDEQAKIRFGKAYSLATGNAVYARTYGASLATESELKGALPLWKFLASQNPNTEERAKLAKALYLNGDYAGSAAQWDVLAKSDPGRTNAEPMVAEAYLRSGQTGKARSLFEDKLKSSPEDIRLLEQVAQLYKQEGNAKGYLTALERIVKIDPKLKDYQLQVAVEKEKAKDYVGALDNYDAWVSRNEGDINSVKAMHRLAEQQKDTTRILEALARLNRQKNVPQEYKRQMAEIDFLRSGNIAGVERVLQTDKSWTRGQNIMVRQHLKKGEMKSLAPYAAFLESESKRDPALLEPLGDLYAMQKKSALANGVYLQALRANAKDRALFDKVFKYSMETASPTQGDALKIGVAAFPEDSQLKLAYAKSLGKTQAALDIYQQILSKEATLPVLEQAVDVAMALQKSAQALQWLEIWSQKEPDEAEVWIRTLEVANQVGNKNKAQAALEKLNRIKPENKEYALALAKVYEEQNQTAKAMDAYKRILGLDPKNRPVLIKLIALAKAQNKWADIKDVLLQVDQADATAHEAQFQLARLLAKDGDKERAYGYLDKALRNQPLNMEYQALLPDVVVSEGQVVDHLPAIERLAGQPGAKPELLLLAARGNVAKKNSVAAARWYGLVYSAQRGLLEGNREPIIHLFGSKNYPAAGSLADGYLAKDPKDKEIRFIQIACLEAIKAPPAKLREALTALVDQDPDAGSKRLLDLAALDLGVRDTAAAVGHAKTWIKSNPKDLAAHRFLYPLLKNRPGEEDAYLYTLSSLSKWDAAAGGRYDVELANLYFKKGEFDDAQKLLLAALAKNSGDASLWYRLGEVEIKLRKDASAKARFQKAYGLAPGNAAYARTYGGMVDSSGEIKSTLGLWRYLATQTPSPDERRKLAQSLFLNGDFAGSALQWDWLLKSDPKIGVSDPMVAESFLRSGQTAKARSLYEERLKSDPNDLKLLEQIAQIYKQEGNAKGYVDALERIVRIDPKHKNYQLLLAQEKEKAKDYAGALSAYDDYISRNEGDMLALRAMQKLSEQQKDTTRLLEALVRITRQKGADNESKRQLAEIDYVKNNNIAGVERLVKTDKGWTQGKSLLVRAYLKKGEKQKLLPFADFLQAESRRDSELLEPLGDLQAYQKKTLPANSAYIQALRASLKDRELFDKVRKYGTATKTPFMNEILKLGAQNFKEDMGLKLDYAASLGKTPAALDVYAEALDKQADPATLAKAVELAMALQRWTQAFAWIDKWSQVEPKNQSVWASMLEAGEKTSSRDRQRAALKGWMNHIPATGSKFQLQLAQLDLAARDSSAALENGKQWMAKNPRDLAGLRFLYPLVKSKATEKDAYLKVLQGLSEADAAAAGRYDLELGALYFERGDFDEAQKVLSKALIKNNKDAALWYRLGEIERKLRKEESAVTRFKKAYELSPNSLNYARTYGESLGKPEDLKATLPLWRFLSTQNPSIDERRKLAQSLYLNGDFAASSLQWDWFMKGDPSIGQTEPMVSEAYLRSGQTAKARSIFEARLKNEPTNMKLLEQVAALYRQEGNAKGYLGILGRIVQLDPKLKDYQLLLAQEKEKARDFPGALDAYDDWVSRNDADLASLKSMHRLSEQQKDTTRLMEALVRLNRQKKVEPQYRYQIVEIDYVRSGNIAGVEKMVKLHPDWRSGKIILVKHYAKQGNLGKLIPHTAFLAQLAAQEREYNETLGDLYAFQKKAAPANSAYLSAVTFDKKDKGLFDKVYKYAKQTESPYQSALLKQGYENFPEDGDIKFDYAVTLGKTQRALDLYQEILGRDRNKVDAMRNGSEIAVMLRRVDVATPLLLQWTAAEPSAVRPWILLSDIYGQARKEDKQAEAKGKISELTPKSAELAFDAGLAFKKLGAKPKALEYFTRASTLAPQNASYAKEYGLALFDAGQADKAKGPLLLADKSIKMDEGVNHALYQVYLTEKNRGLARERLRLLNAIRPANTRYGFALAKLESEMQSPAEVVRVLERPSLKDSLNAEMSFMLLDAYFKTGQKDRAGAWAPVLLRKFPNESRSSLPLGVLFYETKNRAKAKEILEAYSRSNSSEEARYYLGRIHYEERNWNKAIDAFNQAGEFRPDLPVMLGDAYIQNKQPQNAIAVYEKLYAQGKDPKVLTDLYGLYKTTKDGKGLIATLERLLALQPANLDYRVELAELYRLGGDPKKAEAQFEQILKKSPAHPGANLFMGMALGERKDFGRATRMLEIGTARYPDTLRAWKLLAQGYREQNKDMQALQAYKRVIKGEPQNLGAAVARMELSQKLRLSSELPDAFSDVVRLDSNNLEAGMALADMRHKERRYKESVPIYSRVIRRKTDDKEIWANYGIGLLELMNIQEAKRALQKAVDLGAKDMRILTSLARIYKEEGNAEKAESLLNEMVKKDPRNHMAWYELGRIAADRNQDGVAESNYKKALQLSPTTPEYAEALGRLYFSKEDFEGTLRTLDPVRGSLTDPGRLMYGETLMKLGRTDAALGVFNALYASQKSPKVLAKLAEIKVAKGETREALRLIEQSGFASDSSVQYSLAKAYVAEGQGDKARGVINDLLRASKYNAALYHLRGMSYYQEGECKKATKDFDQALKYNPDYMEAVYYTGMCLYNDGRSKDAQNYFKELSQHNNPQWSARGFLGMGLVFEGDKKLEAAQNYLQQSVAKYDIPEAYAYLARVNLKMRKPGDAERMVRKSLALTPDDPMASGILAEVLVAQNRRNEALALTKKALQENPNSCPLLESSAKVNFVAGNYETARQNGLYAISQCPDRSAPYLYVGLVADKKYNKKEAKDNFKKFRKQGGDEALVPTEYR